MIHQNDIKETQGNIKWHERRVAIKQEKLANLK